MSTRTNYITLQDDVIHKVHVGHYTFYSKSIIHDEKQYQIAENVFGAGYKGGENTRFYMTKAELMDDIHAEAFRASIICMLLPYRTNQGGNAPRIQNPIDITGKLHPTLYAETDIPEGKFFYNPTTTTHFSITHHTQQAKSKKHNILVDATTQKYWNWKN